MFHAQTGYHACERVEMLRQFRRNRGFHAAVILLLGLGIGAATLVFSLVNELLLKRLPVRNPRNLYLLEHMSPRQVRPDPSFSERALNEVVRKNPLVSAVAAEQAIAPQYLVPFREGDTTRLLMPQIVSPNYFAELGVRALLGRVLDESDAKPAATLPAVISYHWWQSQFGGDRSILGRTIRLKNLPFVIVGVLPQSFHSADIDRAPDVRLPIAAERPLFGSLPQGVGYEALIRLAPGVAPERAGASLLPELRRSEEEAALERNARSKDPETPASIHEWAQDWTAYLLPIERGVSRVREQFANALWVLLAGVGILLLAVCANVAGLLIAKSGERRKEIGIRLAVGAGRAAIVRQILAENLALAAWARYSAPRWHGCSRRSSLHCCLRCVILRSTPPRRFSP